MSFTARELAILRRADRAIDGRRLRRPDWRHRPRLSAKRRRFGFFGRQRRSA